MAEMFLKLTDINGESLDEGIPIFHKDEIEISHWTWDLTNNASFELNQKQSTKVTVQDIIITKACDAATPTLMKYCVLGKHIPNAKITCRKNDGFTAHGNKVKKLEYLTIWLKDAMVKSVNFSGQGTEQELVEVVTLSFAEFEVQYKPQKQPDVTEVKGDTSFGFDIQKQQEKTGICPGF
jgi:type VI secretion system secreted protein Hcp